MNALLRWLHTPWSELPWWHAVVVCSGMGFALGVLVGFALWGIR